jgi:Fe-S-cluster containining protein
MKRKYDIININLTSISHDVEIADVPCGTCARCCETLAPYLTKEEITSGKYPISLTLPTQNDIIQNKNCGPIVTIFKNPTTGGCGLLVNGLCTVYDDRPLACRQFDCRKGHHPKLVEFAKEKFGGLL